MAFGTHDIQNSAAAESRWVLLQALYSARFGFVSEGVLAAELQAKGYLPSHQALARDLTYLKGKGLVELNNAAGAGYRAQLTADGCDLVEYTSLDVVGVARPKGSPTVQQRQLREARWFVLQVLQLWSPYQATETQVLRSINDVDLELSEHQLRCELAYLEGRVLVELERADSMWRAALTPAGLDVTQFEVDAPAGVARPKKFA